MKTLPRSQVLATVVTRGEPNVFFLWDDADGSVL